MYSYLNFSMNLKYTRVSLVVASPLFNGLEQNATTTPLSLLNLAHPLKIFSIAATTSSAWRRSYFWQTRWHVYLLRFLTDYSTNSEIS